MLMGRGSSRLVAKTVTAAAEAQSPSTRQRDRRRSPWPRSYSWGFSDLGRFAAVHAARYGEAPTETLRRPGFQALLLVHYFCVN